MGITMRQQLDSISGAYEAREREINALQQVVLDQIKRERGCRPIPCPAYKAHPAPWLAEKCDCATEARAAYRKQITAIEAKEFGDDKP